MASGNSEEDVLANEPLLVRDVVQYGTGRASRISLTIEVSGRPVRLTRLPAKDAVSYRKIRQAAMEQGAVLPHFRHANEVWSDVFARAMDRARFEPLLEGEDVADAIAAEILVLLEEGERGRDAKDLLSGRVIERRDGQQRPRLMVSPGVVVEHVRQRLVDDVLPRATIVEAAVSLLGMRRVRPNLSDGRPRAWSFPLPLPGSRALDEPEAKTVCAPVAGSLGDSEGTDGSNRTARGPIHGPREERPFLRIDNEIHRGSNWAKENENARGTSSMPPQVDDEQAISSPLRRARPRKSAGLEQRTEERPIPSAAGRGARP